MKIEMTINQIEAKVEYWETKHKDIAQRFAHIERNALGLVSEDVRLSPEYRAWRRELAEAFEQIRFWNSIAVKARKAKK